MQSVDNVGEEEPQEGDAPTQAQELAKQLSKLRQRGLAKIDSRQQGRLEVPLLEELARRHTPDARLSRIERVRQLLQHGLQAFAQAGHKADAEFILPLFFDDGLGAAVSRRSAGDLLADARKTSKLSEDNFDNSRRDIFLTFADFLLPFVPPTAELDVDPSTQDKPRSEPVGADSNPSLSPTPPAILHQAGEQHVAKRRSLTLLVSLIVGVLLIAAVVLWGLLQLHSPGAPRQGGPSSAHNPSNSSGSTAAPAGRPTLKFDDLGGGSSIIKVYPGVKDVPQDKRSNGTYQNGNIVGAICKVSGRIVTSDTNVGERPNTSNVWIEIAGSPGVKQYAPLTYADMAQSDLNSLPGCEAAP